MRAEFSIFFADKERLKSFSSLSGLCLLLDLSCFRHCRLLLRRFRERSLESLRNSLRGNASAYSFRLSALHSALGSTSPFQGSSKAVCRQICLCKNDAKYDYLLHHKGHSLFLFCFLFRGFPRISSAIFWTGSSHDKRVPRNKHCGKVWRHCSTYARWKLSRNAQYPAFFILIGIASWWRSLQWYTRISLKEYFANCIWNQSEKKERNDQYLSLQTVASS